VTAVLQPRPATDLLHEARTRERAGCIPEAIGCYEAAITAADRGGDRGVLSEALRRLAVVRHHRNESEVARALCDRSLSVAREVGNDLLAAEALNTLGGLDLAAGALADARKHFLEAAELGRQSRDLGARIERNLGIVANIQGNFDEALAHYQHSLEECRAANDEHGCAIAYANLGIVSTDRGEFDQADGYFTACYEIAARAETCTSRGSVL